MWWLTIRAGGRAHCWPVGPDPAPHDELIHRARVLLGFPAGDAWLLDPALDISLTVGELHERTLQYVTMHGRDELDAVDPGAVATYRAQGEQQRRTARVDAAERLVASLPDADKATLRGRLGWTSPARPTDGRP